MCIVIEITNMFEILTSTMKGKELPPVPDSGPGPAALIQWDEDTQAGLFGLIPASQFITQAQIEALATTTLTGTLVNQTNQTWAKYIHHGKILYIPTRTFRTGITWDVLYRAGFVYGVDGPGAYPALSGPVNQKRIVEFVDTNNKTWRYYVRMVKVATTEPVTDLANTAPQVRQSEYACLVERTYPTIGVDLKWATYGSPSEGVNGLNSRVTYTEYNTIANGNSNAYTRGFNAKVTPSGWLPVLELITDLE